LSIESKEHRLKARIAELIRHQCEILPAIVGPLRDYLGMEAQIEMLLVELADLKLKEAKE